MAIPALITSTEKHTMPDHYVIKKAMSSAADSESFKDKKSSMMIFNIVSVLAIIGWIIYTVGVLSVLFVNLLSSANKTEPVYHIAYFAFIIIAFILVGRIPGLAAYRLAVMAFLAVGFNYLTSDMVWSIGAYYTEQVLIDDGEGDYSPKNASSAALAGTCLLIVAWLGMIITLSRSASS
jgi:hypothetical protein